MTTIAFRDGILAADQAIFDRDTYCGQTVKIHRASCGAMGALAAGASASEAVSIACDLDAYTRGPVDTLDLR